MSRKRESGITLSQAENDQVQDLLAHYHHFAETLHSSTNQQEVEAALTPVRSASEAVQMALLKALAKENNADAADVLAGINALEQGKDVRKEARRALLRLESAGIRPQWQPPAAHTPLIQLNTPHPPRFWKGQVSQTREEGMVQLFLCWEQGYDYSEVRLVAFLLDFWQGGVKDCTVELEGRRRADERLEQMRARLSDAPLVNCTLAEAQRLVKEALSVNDWRGTQPAQEYRTNQRLINSLLLQRETASGEDSGRTFINPELEEQEVALHFIGAWSMGDYGLAYDLLSSSSPVHDRLTRDEWIERRRAWSDEAHPTRLELASIHEREQSQSALWLPATSPLSRISGRKEVEVGWSLELLDTPLSGTLKEMPMGTAVNKDTGRHWFWTTFTLVHEQDGWRIQQITDDGSRVQGYAIAELQQRIKEQEDAIETKVQQVRQQLAPDEQEFTQEISWRLTTMLHLYDALIARLPLDYGVVESAYNAAVLTGNAERVAVYLERMVQKFPDNRAENQRRLGSILANLAYKYDAPELHARQEHLLQRAETALRNAVAADASALNHALLAELLLSEGRDDEAQTELLTAREKASSPEEEATIEAALGNLAMRQERFAEAIPHYQRVITVNPAFPAIWFNLGFAQRLLNRLDEAATSYQRAIEVDPHEIRAYAELIAIMMNRADKQQARSIAQQGISNNPQSPQLHALLASVLFEMGDTREARRAIEQAESLDPTDELVQRTRQYMDNKIQKR
ncbi:MAG: tetratricopeptide repeat protein [Ktedonobacteraceae bacterium]|nr:tetratricopeptide repeat protein [Ktedonobacteraceae bacterium]